MKRKTIKKTSKRKTATNAMLTDLSKKLFARLKQDGDALTKLAMSHSYLRRLNTLKDRQIRNLSYTFKKRLCDLIKENDDLIAANIELTRAYNGLAQMGKFAEEQGIDIKKHRERLPEFDKYDFSQEHTVLESGKVRHKYTLTPKKKGKDDNSQ